MAKDGEPVLLSDDAREMLDLDQYRADLAGAREDLDVEAGLRPPNYHKSSEPKTISCGNCQFYEGGECTLYDTSVDSDWVSDSWTSPPED